nr:class I SAM-dependent methyltransferase [Chryseobacterium sp. OSA05B]
MKIVKAAEAFDKSAKIYQDKFMDVSLFADTFNFFCDHIEADDAEILDIACGPGNITKYILDRKPDYKVLGIDLSPKMLDLAQANNPVRHFNLWIAGTSRRLKNNLTESSVVFACPILFVKKRLISSLRYPNC